MSTTTAPAAPSVRRRLIEPTILAQLANLELVARTAVEGMLVGLHRSPTFGFSQEFAEYRAYMPGDDLRYIDWSVYARTDKTYIKRYFGDTNCQLMVLLDTSASMDPLDTPTSGAVTKLDYARFFAAALVYLAARQHDAVGLLAFNEGIHVYHPPATRPARVRILYHELDRLESRGGTDWRQALEYVQTRLRKKSLLVVLSDFYTEPEDLAHVLRGFVARGHDVLLIHVLDPGEREVRLKRAATLRDVETGEVMEVSPDELAADYPKRLQSHVDSLERLTLRMGGHYLQVYTDQPLDRTLAGYLRFRARHF
ncbi:MAG: DUF58 domain-containing protein [Gammaproteobacteria bacterium]|nr:DUF58 domain-containing protein [Gammaproteobacteria bacterium]